MIGKRLQQTSWGVKGRIRGGVTVTMSVTVIGGGRSVTEVTEVMIWVSVVGTGVMIWVSVVGTVVIIVRVASGAPGFPCSVFVTVLVSETVFLPHVGVTNNPQT